MRTGLISAGLLLAAGCSTAGAQHRSSSIRTAALTLDIGFLGANGNADASMLTFGERVQLSTPSDQIRFLHFFRAVQSRIEDAEGVASYRGLIRFDYRVARSFYAMGLIGWERDPIAGIRRRWQETVGLAFEWSIAPADILTFEAGLSAFQQRDVVPDPGGLEGNTTAGHLAGRFRHIFSKDTYFAQSVELIPNFSFGRSFRTLTVSEAAARISNIVSMKLNYEIRYNNRPGLEPGSLAGARLEKMDRIFTAGLSFSF